jgi:hypothetical protein
MYVTNMDLTGLKVRGKDASEYGFEVSGEPIDPLAEDAAFFCDGDGSRAVAAVRLGDRAVFVRCDGMMKVEDVPNDCFYRNASDLITAGFRTDEHLDEDERIGAIYFENNPWFDLYDDDSGESLSIITHTYSDALIAAFEVLLDSPTE